MFTKVGYIKDGNEHFQFDYNPFPNIDLNGLLISVVRNLPYLSTNILDLLPCSPFPNCFRLSNLSFNKSFLPIPGIGKVENTYTLGPVDGNLYATVAKSHKLNHPSNHHHQSSVDAMSDCDRVRGTSIDSGISSSTPSILVKSANHNNNNTINQHSYRQTNGYNTSDYSAGPVNIVQAQVHHHDAEKVNGSDSRNTLVNGKTNDISIYATHNGHSDTPKKGISPEEQSQLDELLEGMLKEVENFPDYKGPAATHSTTHHSATHKSTTSSDRINNNINTAISDPATHLTNAASSTIKTSPSTDVNLNLDDIEWPTYEDPKSSQIVSNSTNTVDATSPGPMSPASSTITSTNERVSPAMPLITDHFGKMEPLPLRFLTKPEPPQLTEKNRPYHARPGSQPFTYGVTAGSPALQRRRLHSESTAYICESVPRNLSAIDSDVESSVYSTLDKGQPLSWLQRQQLKLKSRQEGKDLRSKEMVMAELKGSIIRQDYDDDLATQSDYGPVTSGQVSALAAAAAARAYSPGHYSRPLHVQTNGHHSQTLNYTGAKPPLSGLIRQNSIPSSPSASLILSPLRSSSAKHLPLRMPPGSPITPPSSSEPSPRPILRQKSDISYDRPFVAVKRAYEAARGPSWSMPESKPITTNGVASKSSDSPPQGVSLSASTVGGKPSVDQVDSVSINEPAINRVVSQATSASSTSKRGYSSPTIQNSIIKVLITFQI